MAKKEIRMVMASGDAAGIVDHGFEVDTQLKNLTFEDKGIKSKISEFAATEIQSGETSVRFRGTQAAAVVSAVEKVELDAEAESFPVVRSAIDSGLLEGFVERKLSLVVPPAEVERAAEALKAAGIKVSVAESLSVTADALKNKEVASVEQGAAVKALKACSKSDVSYRVKYEKV